MTEDASGGERALVACRDGRDAAPVLDAALRGEDRRVEQAGDLETAGSFLEDTAYQVVVVDVDLLDDLDRVGDLKDRSPTSTLVVLVDDLETGERTLVEGADDFVVADRLDEASARRIARHGYERSRLARALRQSREDFERLVESIEDGYFEVDLSGTFTYVNDYIVRRAGYDEEEVLGTSYIEYVDEDNAKKLFNAFHVLYETGIPLKVIDFEARHRDGDRIPLEASVFLKRDIERRKIGFWGILRDVSRRKRLEREVEELREGGG